MNEEWYEPFYGELLSKGRVYLKRTVADGFLRYCCKHGTFPMYGGRVFSGYYFTI